MGKPSTLPSIHCALHFKSLRKFKCSRHQASWPSRAEVDHRLDSQRQTELKKHTATESRNRNTSMYSSEK
eukprot:scaffold4223_cov189-Amphora_coffeaeformis.AAC.58